MIQDFKASAAGSDACGLDQDRTDILLAQFIASHEPVCPACDYSLKRLKGQRCPECGESLALRLASLAPVSTPWLIGLIALAAGSGFFVLFPAVILAFTGQEAVWLWGSSEGRVVLAAAPLSMALLGAWVGMREAVHGWTGYYRWLAAWGCLTGVTLAVVSFGLCLSGLVGG